MSPHDVDALLSQWQAARDRSVPTHLQAVETALFLEDTFAVVVPEADIDAARLSTVAGMRDVLARLREA